MSYQIGNKFRVQSTRDSQNREIKHKLFTKRFSDRIDTNDGFICDLGDGTLLQVVSYNNGAVWVVVDSGTNGYLG
jgi:hypothetical protein